MFNIWDFLSTLTVTVLVVGLTVKGYLPSIIAAILLIVYVCIRAFARARKGIKKSTYLKFIILFSLVMIVFIFIKGGIKEIIPILIGSFWGGFEKTIAYIIGLSFAPVGKSLFSIFLVLTGILIILRYFGLNLGSVLIYHTLFSIIGPLFIFVNFIIMMSRGDWKNAVIIVSSLKYC